MVNSIFVLILIFQGWGTVGTKMVIQQFGTSLECTNASVQWKTTTSDVILSQCVEFKIPENKPCSS